MMIESALAAAARKMADRAGRPVGRHAAAANAYHSMCVLLCYCQIVLYATLSGVSLAGPAQWWLILLQFLPASALFLLMRLVLKANASQTLFAAFQNALGKFGKRLALCLYGLLLLMDAWFVLHAMTDIVAAYVLQQPQYLMIGLAIAGSCLIAVLTGGMEGTARMTRLFIKPLFLLLLLAVVTAVRIGSAANLYPYMGPGYSAAAASFLKGGGAVWPVVLMGFAAGEGEKAIPTGLYWIPAMVLTAALPILAYCFVLPYDVLMKSDTWASRIVGFLRSGPSKLVWELFLLQAMALFTCGLCGGMAIFGDLMKRKSRSVPMLFFGLALVAFSLFHEDLLIAVFAFMMPWRFPAALLPLIAALFGLLKKKVTS